MKSACPILWAGNPASHTEIQTLPYAWANCVDNYEGQLQAFNLTYGNVALSPISMCGRTFSGLVRTVINQFWDYWLYTVIPNYIGQDFFDHFDRNKGFATTGRVFRRSPAGLDEHDALTIASIRNDLYARDITQSWVEYLIPSKLATGATYRFTVDIRKQYTTASGNISSISMEILNRSFSAGGGYVSLDRPAPATSATTPCN